MTWTVAAVLVVPLANWLDDLLQDGQADPPRGGVGRLLPPVARPPRPDDPAQAATGRGS